MLSASPSPFPIFVIAVGAVLAMSALALAHTQTIKIATQVKLRNSAPLFHGKVTSDNGNCINEGRKVKLFKRRHSSGKKLLGKTMAADNGKWMIPLDQPGAGSYFAVVTRLEEGTAGTIYVCKRAKSKVIAIDNPN